MPLDLRPGVLNAHVQVKTTESREEEDVKLSVLSTAVKNGSPWFFAFVTLDERRYQTSMRVLHVDERLMTQALQRLREDHQDGKSAPHEHKMRVHHRDGVEIDFKDPEALKKHIIDVVGDPICYAKWKLNLLDKIGYENGRLQATCKLGNGLTVRHLVDWQIGLRDSLTVADVVVNDVRFNVPFVVETASELVLKRDLRSHGLVPVIFEDDGGRRVDMRLECYPAQDVSAEEWKVRFANSALDIVVHPSGKTIEVTIRCPDGSVPLKELVAAADLADFFNGGESNARIEVSLEGASAWSGRCSIGKIVLGERLEGRLKGAKATAQLAQFGGINIDGERVVGGEMGGFQFQFPDLVASFGTPGEGRIAFRRGREPRGPIEKKSAIFLSCVLAPFEKRVMAIVIAIEGPPEKEEREGVTYLVAKGPGSLRRVKCLPRTDYHAHVSLFLDEFEAGEAKAHPESEVFPVWKRRTRTAKKRQVRKALPPKERAVRTKARKAAQESKRRNRR